MIILANKVDLENREVTRKDVEQWCAKENVQFYETSAKESNNSSFLNLISYFRY